MLRPRPKGKAEQGKLFDLGGRDTLVSDCRTNRSELAANGAVNAPCRCYRSGRSRRQCRQAKHAGNAGSRMSRRADNIELENLVIAVV